MQIHELNTYEGELGNGSFLAIDDGQDTGKLSVQNLLSATEAEIAQLGDDLNGRIDNIIAGGDAPSEAEIIDARRGANDIDYSSLGDAIRNQVSDLMDTIRESQELYTLEKVSFSPSMSNQSVDPATGKPSGASSIRLTTERIEIPKNAVFAYKKYTDAARGLVYTFDNTDTLITVYDIGNVNTGVYLSGNIDYTNVKYIRITIYYYNNATIVPADAASMYDFGYRYAFELNDPERIVKTSKNLIDVSKSTIGYYIDSLNGSMSASGSYDTTDFIPTKGNKIVFAKRFRKLLGYDKYKLPITSTYDGSGKAAGYVFTPTAETAYVKISYYHSDSGIQAEYGETPSAYQAYKQIVEEGIHLSQTMLGDISNTSVLTGKKWVACGDSFTQGDFNGLQPSEYQYQDGIYAGLSKVYPYVIGLRTGATIVNEAVGGSSMAYYDGTRYEFSKAGGRYTQIPADADYITLYFGINDSHLSIPIGDIDDAVNTTFYGAWNIVMQYLIANHPDAKIGIIISNGCDSIDYPNAEIAIAKKYGVSYLDFNSDYKVPILFRVNGKPDTDASIIAANYQHYRVSSSNGHPNVAMHEYESTIIQHWLESM